MQKLLEVAQFKAIRGNLILVIIASYTLILELVNRSLRVNSSNKSLTNAALFLFVCVCEISFELSVYEVHAKQTVNIIFHLVQLF